MIATAQEFLQRLVDKFNNSRDFAISFILHTILIVLFGTTVLFPAMTEPPDFEGGDGGGIIQPSGAVPPPPQQQVQQQNVQVNPTMVNTPTTQQVTAITTTAVNPLNFNMAPTMVNMPTPTANLQQLPPAASSMGEPMPAAVAAQIRAFTGGWGKGTGGGTGIRQREFEFTAYIGKYAGGNWNSTIDSAIPQNVETPITIGALPNLLYVMEEKSRGKIKTDFKNVRAINLATDEIFKVKPPFIFLTGTKDFKLSEKEVENLQRYIRSGGCIWGDSSVPGLRSSFDIAFRREMRRVIPDVDKKFEPIGPEHPIYAADSYYPEIKSAPPGINFYNDPVQVLRIYGEIAIIYTSNDYGNMWQFGLTQDGKQIDTTRNQQNQFIALNKNLWDNRETYVRNISIPALNETYKFGINVITHLLTRWETKTRNAPTL